MPVPFLVTHFHYSTTRNHVPEQVTFLLAVTKCLTSSCWRIWAHDLGVQSITVEKAQWQQCEAIGHMASTFEKQGNMEPVYCSLSFSDQDSSKMVLLTFSVYLSSQLKFSEKYSHRYTQECISMVIINPVKLTMKINYHSTSLSLVSIAMISKHHDQK